MNSKIRHVGVFTSGGDAPGMNACVRAVVRTAIHHGLEVSAIREGYNGMIRGEFREMNNRSVANIIHRGGTILRTARCEEFRTEEGRQKAYKQLQKRGIDALIGIGGDGTYAGLLQFSSEYPIPVIGAPGTIDNDLFGTDYTIGFDTALNTVITAVDRIRDTADSHNRVFFIEVMGRDAGYIALHSGIASGAEIILLPETETPVEYIADRLKNRSHSKKLFSLIIVAEGNKSGGAFDIAQQVKDSVRGLDVRVSILGHIQRGGSPSCFDRVLASHFGFAAVEYLLQGRSQVATGWVNNQVILTPLQKAIQLQKPITRDLLRMADILSS